MRKVHCVLVSLALLVLVGGVFSLSPLEVQEMKGIVDKFQASK